jgi:DNA-binding PadR family transcriptional regulator
LSIEIFKADEWAGAGIGSLRRELRQMAAEGLIEAVRTEQAGRWPARTIYQITAEGRRELAVLCEHAIGRIQQAPDAMAAGLIFAGSQDPSMVGELLAFHRQAVERELERLALEHERGMRDMGIAQGQSPARSSWFPWRHAMTTLDERICASTGLDPQVNRLPLGYQASARRTHPHSTAMTGRLIFCLSCQDSRNFTLSCVRAGNYLASSRPRSHALRWLP